jgi:CHAD domain-containing protein
VGVGTERVAGDNAAAENSSTDPAEPVAPATTPATAPARIDLGGPPLAIAATDTFAAAGRKAMWLHVDRMLDREPELRDAAYVDSLRKYRVAMRRLRAALRLFREAYPARELKPLREGLRGLASEVGAVRDLDVLIADLDGWAVEAGGGAAAGLAPVRGHWAASREAGAAGLERRLDAKRHRHLVERLAEFVTRQDDAGGAREARGDAARTVRDHVASSAWLAYERLRALAPGVDDAELETLHGVRIEAKRLRYTLEFLGPVMGPQREWLVERLVALQDHLGRLNDAAVNAAAIRAYLADHLQALSSAERAEIEAYLAAKEQDVTSLRAGVGPVWRAVIDASFAGRLGRAVIVDTGS